MPGGIYDLGVQRDSHVVERSVINLVKVPGQETNRANKRARMG